ncbi:Uncharacterised protein [Candidatus Gugararchaeum adminiculabundum]|nr:Uncharacterised protein [Candidatus Gugararchaeum adminiculabundum]
MALSAFLGKFIVVFFSMLIPGVLLAFPLFKKRLGIIETILAGLCLGFIVPPFLLFVESFAGLNYSYTLALANILLVSFVGIVWGVYTRSLPGISDFKIKLGKMEDLRPLIIPTLLVLLVVFAFMSRIQSLNDYGADGKYYTFFELDPYYYMYEAQYLLTEGNIPAWDYTAWSTVTGETCGNMPVSCGNPEKMYVCSKAGGSHHAVPLSFYLEAMWYSIYTNGGAYDHLTLATIGGAYPAFAAALLVFAVYLLVSSEYGRKLGLAAAGLVAFMPAVMIKMAAGENEIQPWGMFSTFLVFGAYAMAIKKKDMRFAILAAIAYISVMTGSSYGVLVDLVMIGYIGLQAIIDYLRRDEEGMLVRLKINSILMIGVIIVTVCISLFNEGNPISGVTLQRLQLLGAFAFSILLALFTVPLEKITGEFRWFDWIKPPLTEILKKAEDPENRLYLLVGILAIGVLVLAVTPLGPKILATLQDAANIAKQCSPLTKTIAEQTGSPSNFEGEYGFLGKDLSGAKDALEIVFLPPHIAYSVIGIDTWKVYSLAHLLVFLGGIAILYSVYRKSPTAILFLLMIVPVAYVGFNRAKYVFPLGVMVAIAFTVIFGELIFISRKIGEMAKIEAGTVGKINWGVYLVVALVVLLEAGLIVGGPALDVVPYMFKPRYYDNPTFYGDTNATASDNGCMNAYAGKGIIVQLYCYHLSSAWMDALNFMDKKTPVNSTVTSWWDYGHWINFFGNRNAVIRNEHTYEWMEQAVADKFVEGTPEDLAGYMKFTNSKYVLFDNELISKWGALNYLSCEFNNETDITKGPGQSQCEADHSPEIVYVPTDPQIQDFCSVEQKLYLARSSTGINYCVQVLTDSASGRQHLLTYYADDYKKDGTLRPNRGFLTPFSSATIGGRNYASFMVLYMNKSTWYDGKNGWEDRKGKFYDSNFYKGFVLGDIPGFMQVYPENVRGEGMSVQIRIYERLD